MEKCIERNSQVSNSVLSHKEATRCYKPSKVQYFTFGKDNSLVYHPTSQSKKSSASAVFFKTNPCISKPQTDKDCHKKLKSTLQVPNKQVKHLPYDNAVKKEAVSRIAKNLKQASSIHNSKSVPMVIRGTSLKLKPKNLSKSSVSCPSTYNGNVKRCKMCRVILPDIYSSMSSVTSECSVTDSCTDCNLNQVLNSSGFKEKVENVSHKHHITIKRCIICSKLFSRHSNLIVCEKCPGTSRFKEEAKNLNLGKISPIANKYERSSPSYANLKEKSEVEISPCIKNPTNTSPKYKTSLSAETKKLIPKSNHAIKELIQPKNSKGDAIVHPFSKMSTAKKTTISTIAKSLSENSRASSSKPKLTAESFASKHFSNEGLFKNTNKTSKNNFDKTLSVPSSSALLDTDLAAKGQTLSKEHVSRKLNQDLCVDTSIIRKYTSVDFIKTGVMPKSLIKANKSSLSKKNTEKLSLRATYLNTEQNKSSKIAVKNASDESIRKNLLNTNQLPAKSKSVPAKQSNIKQNKSLSNIKKAISAKEANIPLNTELSGIAEKSKVVPAGYLYKGQCKTANLVNKSSIPTDSTMPIPKNSTSRLNHDLSAQISTDPIVVSNTGKSSDEKEKLSAPVSQNITVNNYYFLGTDLKEAAFNSSASAVKHLFSESISLSSEFEDKVKIDEREKYKSQIKNFADLCCRNSQSPKYDSEELCGISTHDRDVNCISVLESDRYRTIGEFCGLPSYLCSNIGRMEIPAQGLSSEKEFCKQDHNNLYNITNPYTEKSLMLFEEMDRIRNEPIDPEKILEELKKNKTIMKAINQMAARKLNFSRNATVFKDLTSK